MIFLCEFVMRDRICMIDPEDGNPRLLEIFPVIANGAELHRASRRHVTGVEDENDFFFFHEITKGDLVPCSIGECKRRCD